MFIIRRDVTFLYSSTYTNFSKMRKLFVVLELFCQKSDISTDMRHSFSSITCFIYSDIYMRLISIQRIVQFNLNSATIFNKLIFVTVEQKEISVPSLVK